VYDGSRRGRRSETRRLILSRDLKAATRAYERGIAIVADRKKARELYAKGCKGGHAGGCERAKALH
jgi:TPR repeat protein